MPIPLAAKSTRSAAWKSAPPSSSTHSAPVTSPRASVGSATTHAPVMSRPPAATKAGQCVRSAEPLAPSLHPSMHVARWTHGCRPDHGADRIALAAGHQCQPSRAWARATLSRARSDGERGQWGIGAVGEGRVAPEARDPELPVGALVEREQLGVCEGPVVGHTLVGPPREVRRQEPGPLGRIQDGAPAHAVVVEHADFGGAQVDRIVRRGATDTRVAGPQLAAGQLPLVGCAGKR